MSTDAYHLSQIDIAAKMKLDSIANIKTSPETAKIPFKREIVWKNVAVYVIGHAAAFYGFLVSLRYSWINTLAGVMFAYLNNAVGIQMGAHRYYAHRSFKATKAMKVLMIICQTVASQNCVWVWVRDHRLHHKYSDTDADPHNASNGFFFSHVGWLLSKKHPEVKEKGKGIDMSDLNADPLVMFQKRHYNILWVVFAVLLPWSVSAAIIGSWWDTFFCWIVYRLVFSLNLTWLVNSWAHFFGMRPYDKGLLPVEVSYIGLFLAGEGWHNYHHTFPWDYKASELGAPYNLGTHAIHFFAKLGMVSDLKQASNEMIIARAKKTGDGTPILAKPREAPRNIRG